MLWQSKEVPVYCTEKDEYFCRLSNGIEIIFVNDKRQDPVTVRKMYV